MMRRRVVLTVARKELRESLRDRRTLFMMVVLPILLYPLLLVLVSQVAAVQMAELEEQQSVVGVLGGSQDHPFATALSADENVEVRVVDAVSLSSVDAAVDVSGWPAGAVPGTTYPVRIHFQSVDDGSRQALDRVEAVLVDWIDGEMERRIEAAGLPAGWDDPLDVVRDNHSTTREQGGFLLASLLPIVVLLTVLMGAYYPAIDLTAGEKERGTIQTLFTAPISALEIVVGKYLAVVGIACISGGANLIGMALVFGQNLVLAGGDLAGEFEVSISPSVFAVLALNVFLVALFFAAVLMAVAVLARSFKEAQTFVTPVYLVCIVPAMIVQLPGFDYSLGLALVPGVSAIVLMKLLLLEGVNAQAVLVVSASTFVWSLLALTLAARLFGQESVILGERGSLRLLPDRATLGRRDRPTPSQALAWYGVLFLLLFYVGATLQARHPQFGLFVTLWLVLLAPTLGLAWYARFDFRSTFHLVRARPSTYAITVMLAISSIVVVNALNGVIEMWFLEPPPELIEEMTRFFPKPESGFDWVWLLFLVAVSPAVCEELVFRGFLLSAFRGRLSDRATAVLIGLAFGLFHLSVYRLFGTTVLGVLMAVIVLRTRSIFPAMLFHALNNGLGVIGAYGLGDSLDAEMPFGAVAMAVPAMGLSLWMLFRTPPADDPQVSPRSG